MESLEKPPTAKYRLLYLQPDPEKGDRICIGVLLRDGVKRSKVIYDEHLSKVRCIAPGVDTDLLRFYLTDFSSHVEKSADLEMALGRFSPQLTTSPDRLVAAPVTAQVEMLLLERFALTTHDIDLDAGDQKPREAPADRVRAEIVAFTGRFAGPGVRVIENARASDVLGSRRYGDIEPVAAAILTSRSAVLVDGIDLRISTPGRSIQRANKIVHTFWQYDRLRTTDMSAQNVTRVGVVLNGIAREPRARQAYTDAHDYALDQFRKEADLAVDGASMADQEKLHALLSA